MNILMLTESNFRMDSRVRQEAYKLKEHGHRVSVIAIKGIDQTFHEIINGISVYRIPKIEVFKYGKQADLKNSSFFNRVSILPKAIIGYGFEYFYFTAACFFLSFLVLFRDKFDVIHTHNPPDTLFLIAGFYKIFGKKFVYDHHDLSPELFLEKYGSRGAFTYKLLLLLEKISCHAANLVIATNESYKKVEIERCDVMPEKIYVVRNGPDLSEMEIGEPVNAVRSKAKTILCYIGAINVQDGVDYLLDVLSKIVFQYNYKDICLLIIGDGDYFYRIKELAEEMGLNEHIIFTGHVSDRNKICRYLSTADIFVDAAPFSFLNDNSTFIKHMEYMVFQKPVVSFALKESMFSLKDAGVFVTPNDTKEMARIILEIAGDENRRKELGINAKERVKDLSWDKVSAPLIQAYETLK